MVFFQSSYLTKTTPFLSSFLKAVIDRIDNLNHPFYAFNSPFERGVLYNACGLDVEFNGELNLEQYESKKSVIRSLGIPSYNDPFNDEGWKCAKSWEKGDYNKAMLHNRSCLLKERDILITRGFREPDYLELI